VRLFIILKLIFYEKYYEAINLFFPFINSLFSAGSACPAGPVKEYVPGRAKEKSF
jgi:hypothetical protein